jgi:hypothetical protein
MRGTWYPAAIAVSVLLAMGPLPARADAVAAAAPAPAGTPTGTLSILDTGLQSTGVASSIAVGVDGLGIISYFVGVHTHQNLRVAHCLDPTCTAITTTDVDTVGDVGMFSSIKIGSDGLPLITYVSTRSVSFAFTQDLKVAHCNDIACTSATITTLDSAARVDDISPLTIGGDGLGLIAYQDTTSSASTKINVAHCANVACTSATFTTIATVMPDNGSSGGYSTLGIATGSNGLGVISYYDGGQNEMLKVAACTNANCSTKVTTIVDRSVDPVNRMLGGWASLTIGSDGLPLIGYNAYRAGSGTDLKIAHCLNLQCTASTTIIADTGSVSVGINTDIAIGGDGLGVVSYFDSTNRDLKLAHCANLACTAATATVVDSFDNVGLRSSVTAGTDGLPLISYQGPGLIGVALRVVHCGNADCTAPIIAPFIVGRGGSG